LNSDVEKSEPRDFRQATLPPAETAPAPMESGSAAAGHEGGSPKGAL